LRLGHAVVFRGQAGSRPADEIIAAGAAQGYPTEMLRPALEARAAG